MSVRITETTARDRELLERALKIIDTLAWGDLVVTSENPKRKLRELRKDARRWQDDYAANEYAKVETQRALLRRLIRDTKRTVAGLDHGGTPCRRCQFEQRVERYRSKLSELKEYMKP